MIANGAFALPHHVGGLSSLLEAGIGIASYFLERGNRLIKETGIFTGLPHFKKRFTQANPSIVGVIMPG